MSIHRNRSILLAPRKKIVLIISFSSSSKELQEEQKSHRDGTLTRCKLVTHTGARVENRRGTE